MEKIYKIYFDGEKIVVDEMFTREDDTDYVCAYYVYKTEFACGVGDANYEVLLDISATDIVLEHSLGDIIAYTFDEEKIEGLKFSLRHALEDYHVGQISRCKKEVEKHSKILGKIYLLD